jgi:hypothetical protein
MKTKSLRLLTLLAVALASATGWQALADGQPKEKTYSGILVSLDAKEKVLKVKNYLFSKSFVMGENCAFKSSDNESAPLADFRPGQQIDVTYRDASGVLIASKLTRERMTFTGQVVKIDTNKLTLTVHQRGSTKTFNLPEACTLVLAGDRRSTVERGQGLLENVKRGNRVTIVYEVPEARMVAREIDQTSKSFVGTLAVVDATDNTITAGEGSKNDKRFHLAGGCAIMTKEKPDAELKDLRVGQKYELSYDEVNGVNVVNRIVPLGMSNSEMSQGLSPVGLTQY